MRKLLMATALLLPMAAGAAVNSVSAAESCQDVFNGHISATAKVDVRAAVERLQLASTHMCQIFDSEQRVDQAIVPQPAEPGEAGTPDSSPAPLNLTQIGVNAVNIIDYDSEIGSVLQHFNGRQDIRNTIDSRTIGALGSIVQDGTNSANIAKGDTIELAIQVMGPDASQDILNDARTAGKLSGIRQTGMNVANMAEAVHAIGVGVQDIDSGATQTVTNVVSLERGSSIAEQIVQSGTNIGNVLIAEKVDKVIRRFDGNQVVSNTVILNDGYRPRINQTGNNIANFISAKEVGTIYQVSTGSQTVLNTVVDAEGNEVRHANFEQTETNYMGASNVVNLMIIEPSRSGGSNEDVAITQEADFDQTASGSSGQSQSGNVLVINR